MSAFREAASPDHPRVPGVAESAGDDRLARLFSVVDGDDPASRGARLRAFEIVLALVIGVEYWLRALPKWGLLAPHYDVLLGVASLATAAIVLTSWRRAGFAALAASHAVLVWTELPATGNHAYLELVLCLLAAFLVLDDEQETRVYLRAVRWLVVVVLFYSGLQKLVHGWYLHGEYLAFSVGSAGFGPVVGLLIAPEELARLAALRGDVGDGPYATSSWLLVVASNAAWAGEMLLAPALCWRRTRVAALAVAVAMLIAIEAAARELFFGLVFANAILCFTWRDAHRRLLPAFVAALAAMALVRLGLLPEVTFH